MTALTALTALEPCTPTFSAAVIAGSLMHISGQIGSDASGHVRGDCGQQIAVCLQKIDQLLVAAHASRADVVKLTAYLVHAEDFALYVEAKASWVASPAPAGTAVVVAGLLAPSALVEIEALVHVNR